MNKFGVQVFTNSLGFYVRVETEYIDKLNKANIILPEKMITIGDRVKIKSLGFSENTHLKYIGNAENIFLFQQDTDSYKIDGTLSNTSLQFSFFYGYICKNKTLYFTNKENKIQYIDTDSIEPFEDSPLLLKQPEKEKTKPKQKKEIGQQLLLSF